MRLLQKYSVTRLLRRVPSLLLGTPRNDSNEAILSLRVSEPKPRVKRRGSNLVFLTFIIFSFLILLITNNAFALSLKVSIYNATKEESLSRYPFKIIIINPKEDGRHEVLKTHEFRTDSTGTFEGKVDVSSGKAIMGEVNYRGVSYYSPFVEIKKGQENYTLDFNVYGITDSGENVEISQRTMMIVPHDEKNLLVFDTITIENNSKFTYVGKFNDKLKINQVLFIPLPVGYTLTNVQGTDQQEISTLVGGIVSQNEILPGESSIFLNYFVKSDISVFDLSLHGGDDSPLIKSFSLFFQNKEKWKVKSSNLHHAGERKFEGGIYGTFNVWEGRELRNIKFKVLAPSYQGFFGLWQASILVAFVTVGFGLFIMKDKIYKWNVIKEKKRLERIVARLKDEADKEDLRGYYMSFRKVLENRSREIEERLKSWN